MKSAVVVPTNRPERINKFVDAWEPQFHRSNVRLLVVEDAPKKTATLPSWVEHFCWADIGSEKEFDCIPRRSGGIRSFGFWFAAQDLSVDMIVSLDDDCAPQEGIQFLPQHWNHLQTNRNNRWFNVVPEYFSRGHIYNDRTPTQVKLNHGLWEGVPDVDALTQLGQPNFEDTFKKQLLSAQSSQHVPVGMYYTMCIMNVAFRREVASLMYMPRLPEGMKRWDDIWCGLIFKKVADLHNWAVTSGPPFVQHQRASDPINNLRQEFLGYAINEQMWKVIDVATKFATPLDTYKKIADQIRIAFPQLGQTVEYMYAWASLWQ